MDVNGISLNRDLYKTSDFGLMTSSVFRWFSGDVCGFHCWESLKVDWSAQRPRVNKQDEVALDNPRHHTGLICMGVMFANGRLFIFTFVVCMFDAIHTFTFHIVLMIPYNNPGNVIIQRNAFVFVLTYMLPFWGESSHNGVIIMYIPQGIGIDPQCYSPIPPIFSLLTHWKAWILPLSFGELV